MKTNKAVVTATPWKMTVRRPIWPLENVATVKPSNVIKVQFMAEVASPSTSEIRAGIPRPQRMPLAA